MILDGCYFWFIMYSLQYFRCSEALIIIPYLIHSVLVMLRICHVGIFGQSAL